MTQDSNYITTHCEWVMERTNNWICSWFKRQSVYLQTYKKKKDWGLLENTGWDHDRPAEGCALISGNVIRQGAISWLREAKAGQLSVWRCDTRARLRPDVWHQHFHYVVSHILMVLLASVNKHYIWRDRPFLSVYEAVRNLCTQDLCCLQISLNLISGINRP